MNKKIILIFCATIVALVMLTLVSFGPLANRRKTAQINPASGKPAVEMPMQIENQLVTFSAYHNKDMAENYYGVRLPANWTVKADQPGSYLLAFANGGGKVYLQDVADNTTLELFILSQDEPQLKKTESNYQRIDYRKLTINNNQAYQLIYQSSIGGANNQTIKTYITGADHAGVVTLTASQDSFSQMQLLLDKVIKSFSWENGK